MTGRLCSALFCLIVVMTGIVIEYFVSNPVPGHFEYMQVQLCQQTIIFMPFLSMIIDCHYGCLA